MNLRLGLIASAFAAAACAFGMVTLALTTGVTQEWFEYVHPVADYARKLVDQSGLLRVDFTLDDLFLVSYATFFTLFAAERLGKANQLLVIALAILGLLVAFLDMIENHHILAMIASAQTGAAPEAGELRLQEIESAFKFHVSYVALVLAALIFPRDNAFERLIAWGIGLVYPLVGIATLTATGSTLEALSLTRAAFFVVGFAAAGIVYLRRPAT